MDIPCKVCGEPWDVLSLALPRVQCDYSGDWYGHDHTRPAHEGCDGGTCRYRDIQVHPDHDEEETFLHSTPCDPQPTGERCPHHEPDGTATDECPGEDYSAPCLCVDGEIYSQDTCVGCASVLETDYYRPSVVVHHGEEFCLDCAEKESIVTWTFPCPECKGTGIVDGISDLGTAEETAAFKRGEGCPCCPEMNYGQDLSPEARADLDALWSISDPTRDPDGMAADYEDFTAVGLMEKVR